MEPEDLCKCIFIPEQDALEEDGSVGRMVGTTARPKSEIIKHAQKLLALGFPDPYLPWTIRANPEKPSYKILSEKFHLHDFGNESNEPRFSWGKRYTQKNGYNIHLMNIWVHYSGGLYCKLEE